MTAVCAQDASIDVKRALPEAAEQVLDVAAAVLWEPCTAGGSGRRSGRRVCFVAERDGTASGLGKGRTSRDEPAEPQNVRSSVGGEGERPKATPAKSQASASSGRGLPVGDFRLRATIYFLRHPSNPRKRS
jgi:hypothetical protein